MSYDVEEVQVGFRAAMRRLAATVTVITSADGEGNFHGMAATAVASVSVDPPTLLIVVNRSASMHPVIAETGRFCVNILRQGQAEQVRVFASSAERHRRFVDGVWEAGWSDLPFTREAQANLFCRVDRPVDYATHTIFIALVEHVVVADDIAPLLYLDGRFAEAATTP